MTGRGLKYLLAGAVGLAMLAGGANAETKLRIAVETTPGDPLNVMLATFRDELKASAGDEVAIEFFDGGALGDEAALHLREVVQGLPQLELMSLRRCGRQALLVKLVTADRETFGTGLFDGRLAHRRNHPGKDKADLAVAERRRGRGRLSTHLRRRQCQR